jgi:hypothetical protein
MRHFFFILFYFTFPISFLIFFFKFKFQFQFKLESVANPLSDYIVHFKRNNIFIYIFLYILYPFSLFI